MADAESVGKGRHGAPTPRTVPAGTLDPVVDALIVVGDMALFAAVDVPGRLLMGRLRKALALVARTEPLVGARYQRRFFRSQWLIDPSPEWIVTEHQDASDHDASEIEAKMVAAPFDPTVDLPATLHLLHLADHDRLLVRISHLLVDGGGTKRFLYRLAEAYRELTRDDSFCPLPKEPARRSAFRLFKALRLSSILAVIWGVFADLNALLPRTYWPRFRHSKGPGVNRIARLDIDGNRLERLKARFAGTRTTINDLLVAAFSRTLEAVWSEELGTGSRIALLVTADFRKLLPPHDVLDNLSIIRCLHLSEGPLEEPLEHLEQVRGRTTRWKRQWLGLGTGLATVLWLSVTPDAVARGIIGWFMGRLLKGHGCQVALTNIGPIDQSQLDFGDGPCLNAWIAAPVANPPAIITSATGCGSSVTFTLGYHTSALTPDEALALLAGVDRELSLLEGEPGGPQSNGEDDAS